MSKNFHSSVCLAFPYYNYTFLKAMLITLGWEQWEQPKTFKTSTPIFHVTAIKRSENGIAIKFKSCAMQEEEQTFIHLKLFNNLQIWKSMILSKSQRKMTQVSGRIGKTQLSRKWYFPYYDVTSWNLYILDLVCAFCSGSEKSKLLFFRPNCPNQVEVKMNQKEEGNHIKND